MVVLAQLLLATSHALAAAPPNIVVIVSDDAGYNEFSMQGAALFPTPRIDSIAANGVRFSQGYTSGAVCSPTRAGLMTGRYQNRFGHEFNIPPAYSEVNGLSLEETTVAEVLSAGGYRTIALGKWHLGYAPQFHPLSRGFSDYYGFLQGSRSYFPSPKPTRLNQLLRDRTPVAEKFDYMTDELGRRAAEYIAASGDKPFFMYLAFNATHGPDQATESDLAAVQSGGGNKKHRAMTIALDRAVGVVLDELHAKSLTDNTLVVFLNDNGGVNGHDNTPLRGFKGSTWEGGVRVPFAMQWPGVLPKGKIVDEPVISLDIFPTAVAAAGITPTPGKPLDGVDLLPFLTGKAEHAPHPTLYWKNGNNWAVRDGSLKLVSCNAPRLRNANSRGGAPELFDISIDPQESQDLAGARPDDVARLTAMYNTWKRDFPQPSWRSGGRSGN
ncbi:Arylsulfatase precursor [Pirellulimonas nuda]|uniref:Arylsulfatase n=1 Tax=Pirellulimonas nuda TaxID=2528009 RepID=A0A518DJT6_9BACT|nr:sulfatase-like hydrolase/transferase [Pirellulimonas nuda]QDU91739.1 Arylsulfatase precursor [Pirellulimonas nuda]